MASRQAISVQPIRRGGKRKPGEWSAPAPLDSRSQIDQGLATFLGLFSVGLGLTEMIMPRSFARFIGIRGDDADCAIVRMFGLRELASGVGILSRPRPAGWLWSRVAGDAMDLAFLGGALASGAPVPERVAAATTAVLGVTALDAYASLRLSQQSGMSGRARRSGPIGVREVITVNRPAEDLYRFWHDFENLPRFMSHLESVEVTGPGRSRWKAKAPAGMTVEWDAEVLEDRPNELIAWRSLEGADVDNTGSVRFVPAPSGRGTEVRVVLHYDPPGGPIGAWIAALFGEAPEQQIHDDLRLFKQVMETGEVVLSDASFEGARLFQRPAQPPEGRPALSANR